MARRSGLSIRAVVFLGFGLIFGLWSFAWYGISLRIADAQKRTASINARYANAQDTLSDPKCSWARWHYAMRC